jgi:signal transduction histidine kinase
VYCGDRRFTNYANLSPGSYTFRVKAANYYGEWNETGIALKLKISTPWYSTWLFRILVLLFLSLLLYAVFRYRLKQKLKLQDVRNRIASDLHDEIGSTLSSVFIYSEVAQNTNNENKISESNQYLKYISSDVAKMIDALSDIVWTVNSTNDRFENIINRMRASAIELFDAKGYELHLDFDESLNALKLGMAERKNFYLFYKEAINNVVKYADGRNVSISLLLSNSNIKLSIQDDGKGFDLNRKSEGNGLNNMKKRAADLKGKFKIHSSANKGTTVQLIFAYS